ncbi:MAG: TVP38/TMEM64 family protein, partial [Rickettsiales bacterium]
MQKLLKIGLLILFAVAIYAFFALDLKQYATLDYIKSQQQTLHDYYQQNTFTVIAVFSLAYIAVTALSLPIATVFTLLGGALFGFVNGLIIVSFTSTIGATLAFLMARFLLRDWVQNKYGKYLGKLNAGFAREGAFYLFALRLAPAFPFFLVNMLMALLPIKTWKFFWVSQLGMLAGTAVYVYAGTELS